MTQFTSLPDDLTDLVAGLDEGDAQAVRPVLLSLRAMTDQAPPPMSDALIAALHPVEQARPVTTRRLPRRSVVFTLSLIGALIAGTGTATAVSPEFREGAVQVVVDVWRETPFGQDGDAEPAHPAPAPPDRSVGSTEKGAKFTHPTPSPRGGPKSDDTTPPGQENRDSKGGSKRPASPPSQGRGPR